MEGEKEIDDDDKEDEEKRIGDDDKEEEEKEKKMMMIRRRRDRPGISASGGQAVNRTDLDQEAERAACPQCDCGLFYIST